jgi:hypothetical protein
MIPAELLWWGMEKEGGSNALQAGPPGIAVCKSRARQQQTNVKGPRNGHGELALGLNVKTLFHYDNNRLQYR